MSVEIRAYDGILKKRFEEEIERLRSVLDDSIVIEHVGSSAVGIGGKNIVDILVGVPNTKNMVTVRDRLEEIGYREGHDSHPDRIFLAFRKDDDGHDRETVEGDFHIHICVKDSDTYLKFLELRDYLQKNHDVALEYEKMKHEFAREAGYDRKKYKALKSKYVDELIKKAEE